MKILHIKLLKILDECKLKKKRSHRVARAEDRIS